MATKFRSVLVELEPEQIELLLESLQWRLPELDPDRSDEARELQLRLEKELKLVMTPA